MKVLSDSSDEKFHDILGRGCPAWVLSFHDRDQLHDDLALLVPVEQVRYHALNRIEQQAQWWSFDLDQDQAHLH